MARSASPSSARRSSPGRPLGVVADGIVVGHRARGQLLAEVLFETDGTGTDPAAAPTEHPHLPGRTVVAVDDQGAVAGIATIRPNHGGPAAHVANASFLVDREHAGRGIGRALGARTSSTRHAPMATVPCSSTRW